MDIYIGKEGQVFGPYKPGEIQERLDADILDGSELAWHEGLDEWVNLMDVMKGEDESVPETEEPPVETESAQEPEPLDEKTLEQINKIKELITDGHPETAWQLIQSLNNPRIYEGLMEDCLADEEEWVSAPEYLSKNGEFFIRLLGKLPEEKLTQLTKLSLSSNQLTEVPKELEKLTQLTVLNLDNNQLTDVTALKDLTQLTVLHLFDNQLTKAQIDELKNALPEAAVHGYYEYDIEEGVL